MSAFVVRAPDRRRRLQVAAALACALSASAVAEAAPQSATATLRVVVRDESGGILPAATVVISSRESGVTRSTQSGADGAVEFVALSPGRYRVTISLDRFSTAHGDIALGVDQALELNVKLSVGGQAQSLDVHASDRPLIEPRKTSLGRTITARELDQLPILVGHVRDFSDLASLTPGIVADAGGGSGIATAGQTGNNNAFLVDGLGIDSPVAAGTGGVPTDAISEFKVVSNQFSAEFGQASGAVVQIVTRSGGNSASGRLSWFQQAGALNAPSPLAKLTGTDDRGFNQAIVDGYWGGPILRNRWFLFGAIEDTDQHASYLNTSPVALEFRPADPRSMPANQNGVESIIRSDVNVGAGRTLAIRYDYSTVVSNNDSREDESALERGRTSVNPGHNLAVLSTVLIGPSGVNEVRADYRHSHFDAGVDGFCPGCAALNYPDIKLGEQANAPQAFSVSHAEAADVVSALLSLPGGRHFLKAGIDAIASKYAGTFNINTSGTYTFPSSVPFNEADNNSYPTKFTQSLGNPSMSATEVIIATFLQDEWQARDSLTVNLGARWDHTDWPGPYSVRDDIAPRLGLSFDVTGNGTTVCRAAAGRFFDETLLNIARDAQIGSEQISISQPGFQGDPREFNPYGFNPNRGNRVAMLVNTTQYYPLQTPYTDQISVGVQRLFGRSVGLTADVVRALGHGLPIGMDLNYPDPVTHQRPSPNTTLKQIIVTETVAQSWYTGLQVGVRTRQMRGQAYSIAYTLSSSENDTDGSKAFPQDQGNIRGDRGPTPTDARHRLTAAGTLALPRGWMVSAVVRARSGLPYNVTTGVDNNSDGVPNDRQPGTGRNSARGTAFAQADVRVSRTFRFASRSVELLGEVFNLTNRTNWMNYNGGLNSSAVGQPTNAGPPRQLQLGMRFSF